MFNASVAQDCFLYFGLSYFTIIAVFNCLMIDYLMNLVTHLSFNDKGHETKSVPYSFYCLIFFVTYCSSLILCSCIAMG